MRAVAGWAVHESIRLLHTCETTDTAPTVIFFDEVDALAGRRGTGEDSKASERVLSQLLTGTLLYLSRV